MSDSILFWHRRDLRTCDNAGLTAARELSAKTIGVFCLDPQILERDDIAPARVKYMLGCLQELQQSYKFSGSQLLVLHAPPVQAIPQLADALGARAVVWNSDVEPYARDRDECVRVALKEKGIAVRNCWDQLLHAPGEIRTKSGNDPYTVYTPFWKSWRQQAKASPFADLDHAEGLSDREQEIARDCGAIALPTTEDLGFNWEGDLPIAPGTRAAHDRLEAFRATALDEYDEQRNLPAVDGTSRLSAALKFGAIGIRTVWEVAAESLSQARSDETRSNINAWQQELAWREFYQHALYFFPNLADGPYREPFNHFPWDDDRDRFQAWCEGKTGYPIVDAAMRQLNATGWMHNRCRMIVASFLTKDLILDWRWGEKYFMQRLVDGDLAANNGGWQWSASSGMDPKPLRIFNPYTQAQKFDADGEYIRTWLPELSSLDTGQLLSGTISQYERDRCGYPMPIVDHKQQQNEFKQRYKAIKN
ncbi:deoxyribodipyrimidine photolyase [Rubidibacter lacunae KORDI 51-2]|uniref:Deoxyribodipyrimidine photo-lyase n=1 Tax=Rubidibacter lacunae KORDI 51-2 TaxID=582515 RepID=U5DJI2_9CHRO|nr:FAD-binding domain-containing protein [Rubidibacter lacunae]ERN41077.1 deoxyribodipyrimidine photolyase [Rubidibacter lacunae KORDI 51-2]